MGSAGALFNAGVARRWRGGVAAKVAAALDQGLPAAAAAAALVELGPAMLEECAGRQVPAAARALGLRAMEIRAGLACRICGAGHDPLAGVHVVAGACTWCVEPDADVDQITAAIMRMSRPPDEVIAS